MNSSRVCFPMETNLQCAFIREVASHNTHSSFSSLFWFTFLSSSMTHFISRCGSVWLQGTPEFVATSQCVHYFEWRTYSACKNNKFTPQKEVGGRRERGGGEGVARWWAGPQVSKHDWWIWRRQSCEWESWRNTEAIKKKCIVWNDFLPAGLMHQCQ